MAHFVLITHWTGGDVFPFIKLSKQLKQQGHQVTLCTHCYYEQPARANALEFVALDNLEQFHQMNEDLHLLSDPIQDKEGTLTFNRRYHGKERLLKEYEKIAPYCQEPETVIICRHRSSIVGLLLGEKLHLPVASMVLAPNYLDHMTLHNTVFGQDMVEEINKARSALCLPVIEDWQRWLYAPKRIFGVWPSWFAQVQSDWPKGIYPIGFLGGKDAPQDMDLVAQFPGLTHKQPVVLITGGSSKMIDPKFYEVAAKACQEAECEGILVTYHESQVPRPLPKGIIYAKDVPLAELMNHVDLVVHHGGMGTLNEALRAGKRQIVMPHLTDGPDNAYRLQKLGVAKIFPPLKWHIGHIAKGIKQSLEEGDAPCEEIAQKMRLEEAEPNNTAFTELVANEQFILEPKDYLGGGPKAEQSTAKQGEAAKKERNKETLLKALSAEEKLLLFKRLQASKQSHKE